MLFCRRPPSTGLTLSCDIGAANPDVHVKASSKDESAVVVLQKENTRRTLFLESLSAGAVRGHH